MSKSKIIIITGCTGTFKTKLSIKLAKLFNGEIINADATQFYQDISVGVNTITKKEMENIPHYLLSFLLITKQFNIFKFRKKILTIIPKIIKKNKIPIIVGGSPLYIASIILPFALTAKRDKNFVIKYKNINNMELYEKLKIIDPEEAKKIHPNNRRRALRALEIYDLYKIPKTLFFQKNNNQLNYNYLLLQLQNNNKQNYINFLKNRIEMQFKKGFVAEVQGIINKYNNFLKLPISKFIGYKEIYYYLQNKYSLQETKNIILTKTLQFIKKQNTFFNNKFKNQHIFDLNSVNEYKKIYNLIQNFL